VQCRTNERASETEQSRYGERDIVKKFVYCMAIDEIANRSRDKKPISLSLRTDIMVSNCREAHCLRVSNSAVDRVACGGSPTHPANGSSGPQLRGTKNCHVLSRRLRLKCDGTRAETRFRLSAKRISPLNRRERQFSRLLAAGVCASAVVMLDTPCSEVV